MENKETIVKVEKALKAYARVKISQKHIINKITNHVASGINWRIGFHVISEASVEKLRKVGFEVKKGQNKPPHNFKYIVSWKHF